MDKDIARHYAEIKARITACEQTCHRVKGSVTLLAASKGQSIAKILAAYQAGQRHFGENYLQEALTKIPSCPKDTIWHFIGPIQSNKTRKMAEHFHWVHSVDSKKIAQRLNDQRPEGMPPLQVCIEVNISHEESKFGIDADNILELAVFCQQLPRLTLRGLMTIPAPSENTKDLRASFNALAKLKTTLEQQGIPLDTLSMGMSEDFEQAIAEGATIVRIGRALFGERGKSTS